MTEDILPGTYVHYKGGRYRVLFTATDSENLAPAVVYMSMETGEIWVRPAFMWTEIVEWPDGAHRARFMKAEEVYVRDSISANIAG